MSKSEEWVHNTHRLINIPRNQTIDDIVNKGRIIPIKTETDLFKEE